jgi:hypothetical protein
MRFRGPQARQDNLDDHRASHGRCRSILGHQTRSFPHTIPRTVLVQNGTAVMRWYLLVQILAGVLVCGHLGAQINRPERKVEGNLITSEHDPKVRIELPQSVRYVGADRWVLYSIADWELHVFVEANAQKDVQRLYWIQFEGYVPTRPELRHNYPMTKTDKLGGMLFDVRARFGLSSETPKPGSDLEHVRSLLRVNGYNLPEAMMNVHFVHLLDDQKRKELMTIYAEDLKPTGFTVNDSIPGGKDSGQWPSIETSLIQRAKRTLTLYGN